MPLAAPTREHGGREPAFLRPSDERSRDEARNQAGTVIPGDGAAGNMTGAPSMPLETATVRGGQDPVALNKTGNPSVLLETFTGLDRQSLVALNTTGNPSVLLRIMEPCGWESIRMSMEIWKPSERF